jgi:hypothetical protein
VKRCTEGRRASPLSAITTATQVGRHFLGLHVLSVANGTRWPFEQSHPGGRDWSSGWPRLVIKGAQATPLHALSWSVVVAASAAHVSVVAETLEASDGASAVSAAVASSGVSDSPAGGAAPGVTFCCAFGVRSLAVTERDVVTGVSSSSDMSSTRSCTSPSLGTAGCCLVAIV